MIKTENIILFLPKIIHNELCFIRLPIEAVFHLGKLLLLFQLIGSARFLFVFQDRVSLCRAGCPGTLSTDQNGLVLRDPLSMD